METLPNTWNGEACLRHALPVSPETGFLEFSTAPGFGDATLSLTARLPDGRVIPVFPPRELETVAKDYAENPNLPFQLFNTPLFPLANRLRGEPRGNEVFAQVRGVPVRMPLNHRGGSPQSPRTHLHGLLYDRKPTQVREDSSTGARVVRESRFAGVLRGRWTGEAEACIRQTLTEEAFTYEIWATNTASTPLPVGFGSHPYFFGPSGDPRALEIRVPAKTVALIDTLHDVFPTGELRATEGSPEFDFRDFQPIAGRKLDFFWTDLIPDEEGNPYAEMIDLQAGVRYRITGITPNIRGVQVYYPGEGSVVAMELVTHLPDPRTEIWGDRETGMQLLAPQETAHYGYRIEVFPTHRLASIPGP